MNVVEAFFGIITRQAIRRGTFESVKELVGVVGTFINAWNELPPVHLGGTADEILPHATRQPNSDA